MEDYARAMRDYKLLYIYARVKLSEITRDNQKVIAI